jgi:hypothetical protein
MNQTSLSSSGYTYKALATLTCCILLAACADSSASAAPAVEQRSTDPGSMAIAIEDSISARVARVFPGYRVAGDEEIRRRLDEDRYGDLQSVYPERQGGESRWIWVEDFDGDGRSDVLVLLSVQSDPDVGAIGMISADGQGVLIGETHEGPNSMAPIAVEPAGTRLSSCVEGANKVDELTIPFPAVRVSPVEVFYWDNDRFESFYTGC